MTIGQADEATFTDPEDQSEDWPWCECGNEATIEEEDTNQCDSCGKPLR